MNQDRTKRKLTAILSADVVGYSRLMETDEAWTIQNLEENKKLMSALIEEHNGRVVDAPGDNLLAEFSSIINAVECAVRIQEELHNKNFRLMDEHRMHFRIGVNLGDVVEEDGRIYGNGVNIAARLEGLAKSGGICISHTAYDQVKGKVNVEYDFLGEYQVKNINEPVRVYRILMGGVITEKYVPHNGFPKRVNPLSITIAVIILLVVALGITIAVLYPKPPESQKVVRFEYELPEGQNFSGGLVYQDLAVSPDGKQFVYSTAEGLYLRSIDELDARLIPGTEGPTSQPFFSPDSKLLGYFVPGGNGQLKKISIDGGTPVTICDAMSYGIHWTPDNKIIFGQSNGDIMQVSANGGTPESLIQPKTTFIAYPQMLPDGKTVMFTEGHKIVVQSIESGDKKELLDGYCGRYLSTGCIVYGMELDHTLYAVSFDLDKLDVTGNPVPIVEDAESPIHWAFSDSGTLVYIQHRVKAGQSNTLVWVDREGKEKQISVPPGTYGNPKISPDGSKVALTLAAEDTSDIYIWDIESTYLTRLTHDGSSAYPIWSSDGEQIFFQKSDPQIAFTGKIFRRSAEGMGEEEEIDVSSDRWLLPWSLSRDGKSLVLLEAVTTNAYDIGLLSIQGEYERKSLLATANQEIAPNISPDGIWLAYVALDPTMYRLRMYVRSIPNLRSDPLQLPTDDRAVNPLWSPNGKELFYIRANYTNEEVAVVAVEVETEPTFKFGQSKVLFQGTYDASHDRPWDIHPDGDKFLMLKPTQTLDETFVDEAPHRIIIVTNWFEELKQRVPVD